MISLLSASTRVAGRLLSALLLSALLPSALLPSVALAGYDQHPQAAQLLQTLRSTWGFTETELDTVRAALASAQQLPQLIKAEQNAAERTETWTTYAARRVDPLRIARGAQFIAENRPWMDRAEAEYGVPPEVIAGVLGLETNFGRMTGSARVLDALATQGFDHPTRSEFFYSELLQFFVMCRENDRDPASLMGSYAGAMGWAQFMPSNYRRLALDFDGNGTVDLWSAPDAIGSIARYLAEYDPRRAWRRGEAMILPVQAATEPPATVSRNSMQADSTIAALAAAGVVSAAALPGSTPAGLIELNLDQGREYWLGLNNFYSVMSYNPRVHYAMTVSRLAQEIARSAATAPEQGS